MTTFAFFNEYGDCLYIISAIDPPDGGVSVPHGTVPGDIWRNPASGRIVRRKACPVKFARSYKVGESIDFTVPDGAVALVNGEKVTGLRAFDTPQRIALQIVGRFHLDQMIEIVSYVEQRSAAYPSIEEQLDMLYHDPEAWRAAIAAVKAQYPKS